MKDEETATGDASSDDSLGQVVDRYMEELADGGQPDKAALLRAHPEMEDELRSVFKTLDLIEAAGRSLHAAKLEDGSKLGEFRIIREIGRGGMGVVYEAEQTSLGRRVALKVLPADVMLSHNAMERFQREAHTAGGLHHTNIVPVYAVGQERGISYYAMQFIKGRSLSHYLKTVRDASKQADRDHFKLVARWGRQAADALAFAHDQGVIHRDIKPANLLLDEHNNIWLFDFGLARTDAAPTITHTGELLGTIRYMSPEQASGEKIELDGRSDIYAFGATLYELAALCPAFEDTSRAKLLHKVIHDEPKALRQLVPAVPRDLATIVAKCMQKNPAQRYQKAEDVAEDLRRFLDGDPIQARPTPLRVKALRWMRRRRGYVTAAAALLVLSVVVLFVGSHLRHRDGERALQDAYAAIMFDQEYVRGAELLDRAESLGNASPDLHLYRGLIPLLNQRPHLAMKHFEKAQQLNPGGMLAWYAMARARLDMGDFSTGQRLFEREGDRRPQTPLGWFLRGYARSRHEPREAIESYSRAIAQQTDFVPAILERATLRGLRLLTEGVRDDLDAMLSDVDAVIVFRPDSSLVRAWRAWAWLVASAYAATQPDLREQRAAWLENCRKDLDQAMKLRREGDPSSLVLYTQGNYLRYVGDYRGAAEAWQLAMQVRSRLWAEHFADVVDEEPNVLCVYNRAIALHAMGNVQGALDEIAAASTRTPEFYTLVLHKAVLLAEVGRIEEAKTVCRESLRSQRSHATGLLMSAAMLSFLGAGDEAQAAVRALVPADVARLTSEHLERTPLADDPDAAASSCIAELDYLAGRCDADSLLLAAQDKPGRRCEYTFFIALHELGQGRRKAGAAMLQACVDTGVFIYTEHRAAQVFLERIRSDPQWPRWVTSSE